MSSETLQNLEQFPLVLGPILLLQPRATTVGGDPEIPTCRDNGVCVSLTQNISPFQITNHAIALSSLHPSHHYNTTVLSCSYQLSELNLLLVEQLVD